MQNLPPGFNIGKTSMQKRKTAIERFFHKIRLADSFSEIKSTGMLILQLNVLYLDFKGR